MLITDCHIHLQPVEMLTPAALQLMREKRPEFARIAEFSRSPEKFLNYLDTTCVDRAVLINSVAPEVEGGTFEINEWVAGYCKAAPARLLPCGSLHPLHTRDIRADLDRILHLGLRLIKLHPPHQSFFPNAYLSGTRELEMLYRAAEENGIPLMFHTGTSVFPGARIKYGDPIYLDDVAVDFPRLTILLAHGGRPLWMDTAFFLVRRHPNVYLDISSIPPKSLLECFPRLEQIAAKTLFGTDWPGPGVPDVGQNLEQFRALPLSEKAKEAILSRTALAIWPA